MARGKKTSEEKREQVKALLCINPDISEPELAKQVGIGKSTAHYLKHEIINYDRDNYERLREQKKLEFIEQAWDTINKIHARMDDKLDNMGIDELKKINIRDLAVALGTMYDKQATAAGEATIISEHRETVAELLIVYEDKLQQLKKLVG